MVLLSSVFNNDASNRKTLANPRLDSTPTSIEFSPNSERVAIGTIQGKVMVYDMLGKQVTIKLHDHTNAISCVTFDHAERILATASWDKDHEDLLILSDSFVWQSAVN